MNFGDSKTDGGFHSGPKKKAPHAPGGTGWNSSKKIRKSIDLSALPWKYIVIVLFIALAVTLCVIYREAITGFLYEVLKWVLIVLAIVFIVRFLIFRRRRRY